MCGLSVTLYQHSRWLFSVASCSKIFKSKIIARPVNAGLCMAFIIAFNLLPFWQQTLLVSLLLIQNQVRDRFQAFTPLHLKWLCCLSQAMSAVLAKSIEISFHDTDSDCLSESKGSCLWLSTRQLLLIFYLGQTGSRESKLRNAVHPCLIYITVLLLLTSRLNFMTTYIFSSGLWASETFCSANKWIQSLAQARWRCKVQVLGLYTKMAQHGTVYCW